MQFVTYVVKKKTSPSPCQVLLSEQSGGGVTMEDKTNERALLSSL